MRQFKNKNTGEVVKKVSDMNAEYYELFKITIENSNDWEEVKQEEKKYEILSFINTSTNIILTKEEDCYFNPSYTLKEAIEELGREGLSAEARLKREDIKIYSVRRLSDNKIFTLRDRVRPGKFSNIGTIREMRPTDGGHIYVCEESNMWGQHLEDLEKPLYTTYDGAIRFEWTKEYWVINDKYAYPLTVCSEHLKGSLTDKETYKLFSSKKAALGYVASLRKPLFVSEDGVEIFEGDEYYFITSHYIIGCLNANEGTVLGKAKKFSTQEKAEEWIIMNKPCLSLEDLLSVWHLRDIGEPNREAYINSPMFEDFKILAEKACGFKK